MAGEESSCDFMQEEMKLCVCGCGQRIQFQPYHKRHGIPLFIYGHQKRAFPIKNVSTEVMQVLLGSILGDGCLELPRGYKNAYYQEGHGPTQKEYVAWKRRRLSKTFECSKMRFNSANNNTYFRIRGYTFLTRLRKEFYPNGIKITSLKRLNQLDPLGLAVWYLDDGHYALRDNIIIFATYNFVNKEHLLIQKYFKDKWRLDITILSTKGGKGKRIALNAKNTDKFLQLIKPIFIKYKIPKCMWYKLGHLWKENEERIKIAKEKRARRMKRRYEKLKKLGVCPWCKQKIKSDKIYCQKCLANMRIKKADLNRKRRIA